MSHNLSFQTFPIEGIRKQETDNPLPDTLTPTTARVGQETVNPLPTRWEGATRYFLKLYSFS